jgi:hypothetical protein
MNYKRRSRRRDKRNMAKCGCCEIITPGKEPIEDGVCNGKSRSKRVTPKKTKCSAGGSHEWVHESDTITGVDTTHRRGYWDCEDCKTTKAGVAREYEERWKAFGWKAPWNIYRFTYCEYHTLHRPYTESIKRSLCLKCGVETKKIGKRVYEDGRGRYYHGENRRPPQRSVAM